jgi:tRNA pseudouridine13 synthase
LLSFVPSVETFVVEEIPAYLPAGEGEHTFLWIEKRDLTTIEAVRRLAGAFGVDAREIGYAGMKDRHSTSRQWVSVPRVDPAAALELSLENLVVLEARRHGNKLRTGHLKGNRFEVVLTGVAGAGQLEWLRGRMASLVREGLPNRYGDQRFGAGGDNAERGLGLLRNQWRERDHRRRRLLLSAAQSAVFNHYLALRAGEGSLLTVREGEVLQKTDSHGLFVSTDIGVDQLRVEAGAVVPTGPMPGPKVIEPPEGTAARALEDRALAAVKATREDFARGGRDLPGSRRPVVVRVEPGDAAVVGEESSAGGSPGDVTSARVKFRLPPGSYATVLIDALLEGAGSA